MAFAVAWLCLASAGAVFCLPVRYIGEEKEDELQRGTAKAGALRS